MTFKYSKIDNQPVKPVIYYTALNNYSVSFTYVLPTGTLRCLYTK